MQENTAQTNDVFNTLYAIDVRDKVKKKNNLSYLSWAAAWAEVKKIYPSASYEVHTCAPEPYDETIREYNAEGEVIKEHIAIRTPQPRPWFDDGRTAWVVVSVTIGNNVATETYAIMDHRNMPIPADKVTSTDANKAKMRALTKACAQHGLGLYIYEGEDMPEAAKKEISKLGEARKKVIAAAKAAVKRGVDRDKIYAMIGEENGGNDDPTKIASVVICEKLTAAIAAMK